MGRRKGEDATASQRRDNAGTGVQPRERDTPHHDQAGGRPPGGRRPHPVRDARIRSKLALILVVPVLAIVGLAADRLIDSGERTGSAALVVTLSRLSGDVSAVTQELQSERMAAARLLTDPSAGTAGYDAQAARTAAAVARYRTDRAGVGSAPGTLDDRLRRIESQLSTMDAIRHQVRSREVAAAEAVLRYSVVINELVTYHMELSQIAGDTHVAAMLRAMASFAQAKAETSDEQAVGYVALSSGHPDAEQVNSFVATLTGQQSALEDFELAAVAEQRQLVNTTITGDAVELADRVGRTVARGGVAWVTPDDLARALGAVVDLMRWAERRLEAGLVDAARAGQSSVLREVGIESILVLITLVLAVTLAVRLARSMVRSLYTLRQGALAVAGTELPRAVARLRDARTVGRHTPDEIAAEIMRPIDIRSRDEIGQVAEAFNVVQHEAVRVAAEQAALRTTVSAMFVNIARRSQSLVDRMIAELDTLERGEEDPDKLGKLFHLDHLATRMRRNDENVLVLSEADSAAPRPDNALLGDVLRAAQCEVEFFDRIDFGTVDTDVSVVADAVNDVVRLLAELFDNATRFSPPQSTVVVEGRRIGDYAVVEVEDRGLGMSASQRGSLNARLAETRAVDVTTFRMMGLAVVARLAGRHGIKVELLAGTGGGTTATVTLPPATLVVSRTGRAMAGGYTASPPGPVRPVGSAAPAARGMPERAGGVAGPDQASRSAPRGAANGSRPPGRTDGRPPHQTGAPRHPGGAPVRPGGAPVQPRIEYRIDPGPREPGGPVNGWPAAADPAPPPPAETTGRGLPRREGAARLVPDTAADPGRRTAIRRSPDDVRGMLSAYQRGVHQGRGQGGPDPGAGQTDERAQS